MEMNSLLMALGLALFGGGTDNPTSTSTQNPSLSTETYTTTSNNHCKVLNQNPQPNETATWNGDCVNGFANGKGTLQWYENGEKTDVFMGNFRQGERHGKGKVTSTNGESYEGDWLNGQKHGKGKYIWANGSSYIGDYQEGERSGFGKLTLIKEDSGLKDWVQHDLGRWQGDVYVVQGIFAHDNLEIKCSSVKECEKKSKDSGK